MSKVISLLAIAAMLYLFPVAGVVGIIVWATWVWFSLTEYETEDGSTVDIAAPRTVASTMAGNTRISFAHISGNVETGLVYAKHADASALEIMKIHNIQLEKGWKGVEAKVQQINNEYAAKNKALEEELRRNNQELIKKYGTK